MVVFSLLLASITFISSQSVELLADYNITGGDLRRDIFRRYDRTDGRMFYSQFAKFIFDYSGATESFSMMDSDYDGELTYSEVVDYFYELDKSSKLTALWWFDIALNETLIQPLGDVIVNSQIFQKLVQTDLASHSVTDIWKHVYHEAAAGVLFFYHHYFQHLDQDVFDFATDSVLKNVITNEEYFDYFNTTFVNNHWDVVQAVYPGTTWIDYSQFENIFTKLDIVKRTILDINLIQERSDLFNGAAGNKIATYIYGPHELNNAIFEIIYSLAEETKESAVFSRRRLLGWWHKVTHTTAQLADAAHIGHVVHETGKAVGAAATATGTAFANVGREAGDEIVEDADNIELVPLLDEIGDATVDELEVAAEAGAGR